MASSEIFKDISKSGKDRRWRERKLQAGQLAKAFEVLGFKKFRDTYQCANVIRSVQRPDGTYRVKEAYFCKDKLCPICSWRRSMKYSTQTQLIMDEALKREPKARFIFLTLSARNVWNGHELDNAMSELTAGFSRLFQRAKVKRNLIGWVRASEVTVSDDPEKPEWRGSYNQHIHVLLMLRPAYFKGGQYIAVKEWQKMWQQSLRVDYTPIVDVRTVKPKKKGGDLRSAVLETAKYPVKPIKIDFSEESLKQVNDLHVGLAGKRQLAYGGLLREIKKELGLEDVETSDDLVHVDEETGEVTTGKEIVAAWDWQRKNYYVVHGEIPVAEGSKEVWT